MNFKYKYEKTDLIEKIKESKNLSQLLKLLNIIPAGGNYATMNRHIKHFNIDTSHWGTIKSRQGHLRGKTHKWAKKFELKEILIENSSYAGGSYRLKNRLLMENFFEKKCYNCNLLQWMNVSIPLELEHKNGKRNDNRIENLTLLCPNCHALTKTYRGKNKSKTMKNI